MNRIDLLLKQAKEHKRNGKKVMSVEHVIRMLEGDNRIRPPEPPEAS